MQVMFVLGLGHALTKLDTTVPDGLTRIGLQDGMRFIRSAAALNRKRPREHTGRGYTCGVWVPGFERFEDQELPLEIRNMCTKVQRSPRRPGCAPTLRHQNGQSQARYCSHDFAGHVCKMARRSFCIPRRVS